MGIGKFRSSFVLGYLGHGRRYGIIPFGNGYTLRAGSLALHVWRLSPNDRGR